MSLKTLAPDLYAQVHALNFDALAGVVNVICRHAPDRATALMLAEQAAVKLRSATPIVWDTLAGKAAAAPRGPKTADAMHLEIMALLADQPSGAAFAALVTSLALVIGYAALDEEGAERLIALATQQMTAKIDANWTLLRAAQAKTLAERPHCAASHAARMN